MSGYDTVPKCVFSFRRITQRDAHEVFKKKNILLGLNHGTRVFADVSTFLRMIFPNNHYLSFPFSVRISFSTCCSSNHCKARQSKVWAQAMP